MISLSKGDCHFSVAITKFKKENITKIFLLKIGDIKLQGLGYVTPGKN